MSSLLRLFETSLAGRAGHPGLDLGPVGGPLRTLTFGELDRRADRTAGALAARGLVAGDRLASQLPNGLELIELFLACLRLGVVLVPVNVLYRAREIARILEDAEPRALVTDRARRSLLPPGTIAWDVGELDTTAEARSGRAVASEPTDGTPALIVYTSGTTGRAKGAVLSHGNLAANARTLLRAWRIDERDRYLAVLPLFHVHGLGNGVCCWLASGCRMRLLERFDHAQAQAAFAEFEPTLFFGVPTIYVRLLELPEEAARAIGARMRLFVSGSAPLPATVFEACERRLGHRVLERYGMTETLMTVGNPYDGERRPGSVGVPFDGVSIRIVDRDLHDVPAGGTGELLVRGESVFGGYWRLPEATAAAFVEGWFRTGDLASRAADGYVSLHGRASELILCGGFNVYPREIEDLLLEQQGVAEAAVVGMADPLRGERPVAFFSGTANPLALEAACRSQLASFKVPARFLRVAALPRNALGKVEKGMLRLQLPPQGVHSEAADEREPG